MTLNRIGTETCQQCSVILNGTAFVGFQPCEEHDPKQKWQEAAREALPLVCSQGGIPYNKEHLDAKDTEIARLRAEVERLTTPTPVMSGGIVDWKAAYEFEYKRANELERERDEARAQVAVLLDAIDKEHQCKHDPDIGHIVEFPLQYAAEARALLDRLHAAEKAATQPYCSHESTLLEKATQIQELEERLQRAEAVVEVAEALKQDCTKWPNKIVPLATANLWIDRLLAAWEEGKA